MTARPPLLLLTDPADSGSDAALLTERLSKRLAPDGVEVLSAPVGGEHEASLALSAAGHERAVAVPLVLLAAGWDAGRQTPLIRRGPAAELSIARPFGPHPAVLRLLEERADTALAGAPRDGSAIVLVGRGPDEPQANAETAKVARLLWEGRGFAQVEPAYLSSRPTVDEAVERCRRLGAQRTVVLPYALFAELPPLEPPATLDVRAGSPVGDCEGLADVVLERYAEVLDGDLRTNCDTCFYRPKFSSHSHGH
ncbi:sirohydrochlorin chelatase [Motilibacter deserti]|uniref:Sirohydrochlorin chelatase n=1 Tax=Motilibacter deserti TaxID=2714956 RepID=A0ABX0GTX8_9ACTN|nr:CbiX/SirB N-terminal domain-containing protein [Motilibacter deserti]NHC12768.1 sirohydrochlorin chelatase [Motilibacter deserti]